MSGPTSEARNTDVSAALAMIAVSKSITTLKIKRDIQRGSGSTFHSAAMSPHTLKQHDRVFLSVILALVTSSRITELAT